jgi:GNAT superfamily N-acetyltransferase
MDNSITIEPFQPDDLATVVAFVAAIQEIERVLVPELKTGAEIADEYTQRIMGNVAAHDGVMLMAKRDGRTIGFACAWPDGDDDPLLRDDAHAHALVSDIYVDDDHRRTGIARRLLAAVEARMLEKGCRRLCICAKAANLAAVRCYEASGFRPYEVIFWKPIAPSQEQSAHSTAEAIAP